MSYPLAPRKNGFLLAITSAVIFVGVLSFPYSSGYSFVRRPMFEFLRINWSNETWSHCWLVIPILCWLIYRDRDKIAAAIKPSEGIPWGGGLTLAFGCLLYWAGYRTNNLYLGYGGVQFIMAGVVVILGGFSLFRALLFHWLFLGFLWPLIFLEHSLAFTLRSALARISSAFLNLIGIANFQSGTALISSPNSAKGLEAGQVFQLDIEGPCSGLRSLYALTMIGALFAYLTQKTKLKGIILFLCSFPFAMLGNFARLLLLVFGTMWWGADFAIGPKNALGESETSKYHFFAGIAVFLVSLTALYLMSQLLAGRKKTRDVKSKQQASSSHV